MSQQQESKRDLLKRMQFQLLNYKSYIVETLKQAYNQKFLECSQKGGDRNSCQESLNYRMKRAQVVVSSQEENLVLQFRDCSKNAKSPEDMYVCFNTMMMAKESQLEEAKQIILQIENQK